MAKKEEVEEKILEVAHLILQGMTRPSDIVRYCSEKLGWSLSGSQIRVYIERAREVIRLDHKDDIHYARSLALSQLDELIRRNLIAGDLREARNCIKAKAELQGLLVSKTVVKKDPKTTTKKDKPSDSGISLRGGPNLSVAK